MIPTSEPNPTDQSSRAAGVMTRAHLLSQGVTDREIRSAVAAGKLARVARGVYRRPVGDVSGKSLAPHKQPAPPENPTPTQNPTQNPTLVSPRVRAEPSRFGPPTRGAPRLRDIAPAASHSDTAEQSRASVEQYREQVVAVAARGDGSVVSHVSAAAVHRIPLIFTELTAVHLTRNRRGGGSVRGPVFRHAPGGRLPVVKVDGIRVTSPARTLVDLARSCGFVTAVAAIDAALHSHLVTSDQLDEQLRLARRRAGIDAARRAVGFADPRSESVGESFTRATFHLESLAPPDVQVEVFDQDGRFLARSDFGYRELGLLLEFDGLVKYGGLQDGPDARTAVVDEKRREDRLRQAGFVVLRLTWRDVQDRTRLRDLLDAAMGQAKRARDAGLITGYLGESAGPQ